MGGRASGEWHACCGLRGGLSRRETLGGRLKTGNLWTGQTGNFLTAETREFYFVAPSVRKSVLDLRAPAARAAFEHVRVVQQPIEQRGDRGGVAEQLPPTPGHV
jgi:hypothetical protein